MTVYEIEDTDELLGGEGEVLGGKAGVGISGIPQKIQNLSYLALTEGIVVERPGVFTSLCTDLTTSSTQPLMRTLRQGTVGHPPLRGCHALLGSSYSLGSHEVGS